MSYEHKVAMNRIITLCSRATKPNKRTRRIYDIALEAEGLVKSQRDEIINKWYDKLLEAEKQQLEIYKATRAKKAS